MTTVLSGIKTVFRMNTFSPLKTINTFPDAVITPPKSDVPSSNVVFPLKFVVQLPHESPRCAPNCTALLPLNMVPPTKDMLISSSKQEIAPPLTDAVLFANIVNP